MSKSSCLQKCNFSLFKMSKSFCLQKCNISHFLISNILGLKKCNFSHLVMSKSSCLQKCNFSYFKMSKSSCPQTCQGQWRDAVSETQSTSEAISDNFDLANCNQERSQRSNMADILEEKNPQYKYQWKYCMQSKKGLCLAWISDGSVGLPPPDRLFWVVQRPVSKIWYKFQNVRILIQMG